MGRLGQYSWQGLVITCALLAAKVHAVEVPTATPYRQSAALSLAQPKGGSDPTCTTGVIDDNGFESGAGGDAWESFSKNHGTPLCGVECLGGGPAQAFIGHGWVHFRNAPDATETAYVRQAAVFPVENQGNLRFYLRGFPAVTSIDFRVYVDESLLVALNETQLAAYNDYLPFAFDITNFLDGASHVIEFVVTMEAGTPTSVYIDEVCVEIFGGGEGEGEPCEDVCNEDPNDTDMDGLSDQCESCYSTNPALADSDDDGMTDIFEIVEGLQPQNPLDGYADLDGDGLTNVEEFHRKSRPYDVNDPYTVVYVGPAGDDSSGTGAANNPWQTLGHAVANVTATAVNPALIFLLPGVYGEFVALAPNIAVRSTEPLAASITGGLTGADGCLLDGILFAGVGPGPKLLLDNCAMRVQGCRFAPDFATAAGIQVTGAASAGSVIDGCVFDGCDVAVDVYGGIPFLLRNQVTGWNSAGIWIHAADKSAALNTHGLGDAADPSVGYNQFVNGAGGQAVVYENPDVLKCEQNFWGTDNVDAIDNQIDGAADFEPFLVESQLLPAGLTCTLLNGADQSRITNGTVLLAPSSFSAITENVDGVYGFGVLGDGAYTVTATAPGLGEAARTITLTPGAQRSVVLVIGAAPPPQCGCNQSGKSGTPPVGDLMITLCVPLSCLAAGWLSRRSVR